MVCVYNKNSEYLLFWNPPKFTNTTVVVVEEGSGIDVIRATIRRTSC